MSVITRLRRAFGMTALALFTKSRGSEMLAISYFVEPLASGYS
jgi:hypothetical protein